MLFKKTFYSFLKTTIQIKSMQKLITLLLFTVYTLTSFSQSYPDAKWYLFPKYKCEGKKNNSKIY